AVVLKGEARAVVGAGAALKADAATGAEAAGEERAQLGGTPVRVLRAERPAEVPVSREGAHYRLRVPRGQGSLVAADRAGEGDRPGREYRGPDGALLVKGPLAAVGAEYHRLVGGGLGQAPPPP